MGTRSCTWCASYIPQKVLYYISLTRITQVLVSTESLPLSARSFGMSIAVGVNFLGGAGVTGTFISLANLLGLRGAVLVYAAICALSDLFVVNFVPIEFDLPELNLEYSSEIISSPMMRSGKLLSTSSVDDDDIYNDDEKFILKK